MMRWTSQQDHYHDHYPHTGLKESNQGADWTGLSGGQICIIYIAWYPLGYHYLHGYPFQNPIKSISSISSISVVSKYFQRFDANKDGKLSRAEFQRLMESRKWSLFIASDHYSSNVIIIHWTIFLWFCFDRFLSKV